jgi:GNAT superfamily N-acetyltransferase
MQIRDFTPEDYPATVAINNAIFANRQATVQDFAELDQNMANAGFPMRRWLAVEDGRVVGMGEYAQYPWTHEPGKFIIDVRVLPGYRRRGFGAALYDTVTAVLAPLAAKKLQTRTREDFDETLRFLEARGFVEGWREGEAHLDVAAFDPAPYADLGDKLAASGIEIKTMRELSGDPDLSRKLYDLTTETVVDIPGEWTWLSFEQWETDIMASPLLLDDGFIVACETSSGEYVGFSSVWAERASDSLHQWLTGVRRGWRDKGIATALKVRAIVYAQAHGHPVIKTDNAVNNRPMRAVNEKLGFVPQTGWIYYLKEL